MNKIVRNERRKLTASWISTVATALTAAGAFAPVASYVYGVGSTLTNGYAMFLSSAVCVLISVVLHLVARLALGGLEE